VRTFRLLCALVVLAPVGFPPSPAVSAEIEFRIIVHPDVSGTHLPREALSAIFLRDEGLWADGQPVRPVDQSLRSPVRAAFTEVVFEERMDAVQALWARRIGQGVTPPMVKSSDEDVVAYVASTKGAIGYVSVDTSLPPTVRILSILY
jgi:ABC-type phosphate transport system substrate-binding protein